MFIELLRQNPSPVQVPCQLPTVRVRPHPLLKQPQETFPGCSAYPATCSGLLGERIVIFLPDKKRLNRKVISKKHPLGVTWNPTSHFIFNSFSRITVVLAHEVKVVLKTLQKLADDSVQRNGGNCRGTGRTGAFGKMIGWEERCLHAVPVAGDQR